MRKETTVPEPRSVPLARRLALGVALGLALGLGVHGLSRVGLLGSYELRTLDWRHQLLADHRPAADEVAVVLIDEYSIDAMREDLVYWPWPRDVYEPLLGFLARAGAKAAVFDLIFADPDKSRGDAVFAEAAKGFGNAVYAVKLDSWERRWEAEAAALERGKIEVSGDWPFPLREGIRSLVPPLPEYVEAASLLGVVNVRVDPDGRLRRADLLFPYPDSGTLLPSLGLAGALAAIGPNANLALEGEELRIGERGVPLGPDGRALVRFYGGVQSIRTENAVSVIRSLGALEAGEPLSVPLEVFKDRVVFLGVNASGMEDIVPAPVGDRYPGTELLATVCANVLGEDFLWEPGDGAKLAALFALGACAGAVAFGLWKPRLAVPGLLGLGVVYGLGALVAFREGLVLELFFPALLLAATFGAEVLCAFFAEGRQKREVSRAFAQYMSPDVIRDLLRDPDSLRLGGETREITVYFSDLKGFSSFSEGMTPSELVSFLNVYLTGMTDAILDHRGTIDKYEGDAIMAFWGAPLALESHALEACLATIEQRKVLARLNDRFQSEGRPRLSVRVGLNCGTAVVGNMGSTRRFAYTAMGDTVNLASRLEGANKFFGTDVMMSEAVRKAAGDRIAARRLGRIRVVGKSVPVTVYELLGESAELGEGESRRLAKYHDALNRLEGGRPGEAGPLFAELLEDGLSAGRKDSVVDLCLAKCRELEASSAPWDGIWILKEKG